MFESWNAGDNSSVAADFIATITVFGQRLSRAHRTGIIERSGSNDIALGSA
jgi:hypothetical protein